jgi:hypothetical protein
VNWLDTVAERRFGVALLVIGVIAFACTVYAVRQAWRRAMDLRDRRRPTSDTPLYARTAPGPHAVALGVGALRAVAHREPVDHVGYTRPRRRARALLAEDAESEQHARTTVPRALRALLGGEAEVPAHGIALVEEALRQRNNVGPELWPHALEDFATTRGLPYAERQQLLALVVDIGRAEDRLRREGLLGPHEIVPSLLACHWGEGVHIVRTALRAEWLTWPEAQEYLTRADELAPRWYPTWSALLAAQLLPALLNDDVGELSWRLPAARRLLTDPSSPVRKPLNGGFGLAVPR